MLKFKFKGKNVKMKEILSYYEEICIRKMNKELEYEIMGAKQVSETRSNCGTRNK